MMNDLLGILSKMEYTIEQVKSERDSLIKDIDNLRKERDDLKHQLDEVVSMVNSYITAERAYSGDGAQNLLENELNRILEGE